VEVVEGKLIGLADGVCCAALCRKIETLDNAGGLPRSA
jgi:hypothetical protein